MQRCPGWIGTLLLCLVAVLPARAQAPVSLTDVLAGKVVPLTQRLGDCQDGRWATVTVRASPASPDAMARLMLRGQGDAPMPDEAHYLINGETLWIGGQAYLSAYCLDTAPETLAAAGTAVGEAMPDTKAVARALHPIYWTRDTAFPLSLLHLATVGDLRTIRPFTLAQALKDNNPAVRQLATQLGSPSLNARVAARDANMRMINNALEQFRTDIGVYPSTLTDLTVTQARDLTPATRAYVGYVAAGFHGPYLSVKTGAIGTTQLPANPFTTSARIEDHWVYTPKAGADYVLEPNERAADAARDILAQALALLAAE